MTKHRTQIRGDKLKQEVLRVALRHFALKGYAATNMDEIAEEIGINKPSIYYHIGKKEEVFETVVTAALDSHLQQLRAQLDKVSTPVEKLKAYVFAFADTFSGENRYLANLMLSQMATQEALFPKSALEKMMAVQRTLWGILTEGVEQRVFKPVNPFMFHMLIVGFLTTYAVSEPMKQKIAEATNDNNMNTHVLNLHQAADMMNGILLDSLHIGG